jgi:thiol-disulfide isomerase/thioredoxin
MKSRVLVLAAFALFSAPAFGRVGSFASLEDTSRLLAQDIGLELGTVGPGAKVETLDGKAADMAQYVGTKPALLEFWATWCPNCRELEPTMKAMHAKYGSRVNFVGVAVSVNQSPERVKAYVAKHRLPWTQVFDRKGNASGAYEAPATSYVVVLDRAGKVVYTGLGGKQDLETALKKALGG